ncbi:MAG: hypothetical protein ACOX6D_01625 [Thermoguttaceae bacterium]|jgi:hypothetical protein
MEEQSSVKRRSFLQTVLLSFLSIGTGGALSAQEEKEKIKALPKKDRIGTPLPLPPNQDVVWTSCFSPSGKKAVLVCGDMTKKSVFLADFPVKNRDDYQLIKSFDNCCKIDGISVYEGEDPLIALRETRFQLDTILTGIQTSDEWKAACEDHNINEKSFSSSILVVDIDGNQTIVGETAASLKESLTASAAWQNEKTLWFLDKESRTLSRFNLSSNNNERTTLKDVCPLTKIQQISYNKEKDVLIALDSDRQIGTIDPEDCRVELKSPLDRYIPDVDINDVPCLDSNGESVVLQTDHMLIKYNIDDHSIAKLEFCNNDSTDFRLASISSSADAILVYLAGDIIREGRAPLTELRTLKIQ